MTLDDMPWLLGRLDRAALVGLALAVPVALTRAASPSGLLVGACAAAYFAWAGDAQWLAVFAALVVFGTAATKCGAAKKRGLGVAEIRDGRRTWRHVVANAGPAVLLGALGSLCGVDADLAVVGALAASLADTVSGELGMLTPGEPRSLLFGRPVARGTDGGMTFGGTALGAAGAAAVALIGAATSRDGGSFACFAVAAAAGGLIGTLADSVIGAAGLRRGGFDNDAINFVASLMGGLAAAALGVVGGAT